VPGWRALGPIAGIDIATEVVRFLETPHDFVRP
jgi:hypothetical protein